MSINLRKNNDIKQRIKNLKKPSLGLKFVSNLTLKDDVDKVNLESHLGGKPYITKGDEWPICPNCDKHMSFIFQLRQKYEDGNINLKTLYTCNCSMDTFTPFVKILSYDNPDISNIDNSKITGKKTKAYFDIILEPYWNVPNWTLLPLIEPNLFNDILDNLKDPDLSEVFYNDMIWELNLSNEDSFNAIKGYPEFVNNPKLISCMCCNKIAEFYFQIESNNILDLDFGGAILYCFRCSETQTLYFFLN